jgi:hypothetical protein
MIYLDANFFVFANFDTGPRGEWARKVQRAIVAGRQALTSVLALDEVMWVLIRNKRHEQMRAVIEEIYAMPNLVVKEVPALAALTALDIMEHYGLKPRDAFHVAVMKSFGLREIVTDDPDFDKVEWIRRVKF